MAVVTICNNFGAQENKVCHCFHCFPICLPWGDGIDAMIFVFWMLHFKPNFSLSSFITRLFSSSLLSAIRVVSSVYLRLLIFLPAILIPACASSSLTFHMMVSGYKLNKQGDSIQPCVTQWNFEPCRVEPPKMDGSRWRVLTKHGPLEKWMANHFNVFALRTSRTVWKGKKIWLWKMNSPSQ